MSEAPATDERRAALRAWLDTLPPAERGPGALQTLAADASFRRYFRWQAGDNSYVAMDAPPEHEGLEAFVDIAQRLRAAGLHAPEILAGDRERGFLLLEDLGDRLYRDALAPDNVDALFGPAFDALERFAADVDCQGLPDYDAEALQAELDLFPAWYLERHRGIPLDDDRRARWDELCAVLIANAREQPQGFVHRDFHSCNLLLTEDNPPGIIDFQDAVRGPVSYDLVSLLLDRYVTWSRERLEHWMETFRSRAAPAIDPAEWRRRCDWMGLQRNLKIVGIFCRLNHRDGKPGYLDLLPRFKQYISDVLRLYPDLRDHRDWLEPLL